MTRTLHLELSEPERRCGAALARPWVDLCYTPGPGLVSELEPGVYAASLVIVLDDGPAIRVSSLVVPAFGGELCRLRLEPLASYRAEHLGSFFDPARRGLVYALDADRRGGGLRPPPDRTDWTYRGPSLAPRLGDVRRVQLVRERASGGAGEGAFGWTADRGLVLISAAGEASLLLARPDDAETAALVSPPGLYRALIEPDAAAVPGATPADLLGFGDWEPAPAVSLELVELSPPP